MKKPFIAIFTERPIGDAALLVVFANRDAQTLEDVEGTRQNLENQGEGPHIREFDSLREIPDHWDLGPSPAGAGETPKRGSAGRPVHHSLGEGGRPGEGNAEKPTLGQAAADPTQAERAERVGPQPPPGASILGPDAVSAIHDCLKRLAGCCDGARTLDGAGFNKLDTEFGHSLAHARVLSQKQAAHGRKLVRKYHRQLPADLLRRALAEDAAPATDPPSPDASDQISGLRPPSSDLESVHTPAYLLNAKYGDGRGDTYQNGVRPGPIKLAQFIEVLQLTDTPALYSQEGQGDDALVHVKLFDPTGSWTWYITEFDEKEHVAFGLVDGHDAEVGYIDFHELANVAGRAGIGIEIDMHFTPQTLRACREALAARAN